MYTQRTSQRPFREANFYICASMPMPRDSSFINRWPDKIFRRLGQKVLGIVAVSIGFIKILDKQCLSALCSCMIQAILGMSAAKQRVVSCRMEFTWNECRCHGIKNQIHKATLLIDAKWGKTKSRFPRVAAINTHLSREKSLGTFSCFKWERNG